MINTNELFEVIDNGREGKNIGLSTGLQKLDDCIGGIQKGAYILISGGSGSGKSSIALYSFIYRPLRDNPEKDLVYIYYSLEMSANTLLAKLLGLYIYEEFGVILTYQDIMSWKNRLSDENYKYLLEGKKWLDSISHKLVIYDRTLNRNTFYTQAMRLLEEYGNFVETDDGLRKIYKPKSVNKMIIGVLDHIGLCRPLTGATQKEEMDAISSYAVTLKEKCSFTWIVLQQENRNNSSFDARKLELTEPSPDSLKASGNTFNDCTISIGIYYPEQLKIKTHRGYPIICEDRGDGFKGLRSTYRALFLMKSRFGDNNKCFPISFFGEIGFCKQLPKASEIQDWTQYLSLSDNMQEEQKDTETSKELNYSF